LGKETTNAARLHYSSLPLKEWVGEGEGSKWKGGEIGSQERWYFYRWSDKSRQRLQGKLVGRQGNLTG
jgi:hypothetical protein